MASRPRRPYEGEVDRPIQRESYDVSLRTRRAIAIAKTRRPWRSGLALAAAALVIGGAAGSATADPVLVKVVMVSRHGVRSPTQTGAALQASTGRAWPAWPVGPGELTDQGKRDLALMGGFLRTRYQAEHLLPKHGCPAGGTVQIWADSSDHRTRESGATLAEAFAPACGVVSAHAPDGDDDPLFDGAAVCPVQPDAALAAITARAGGDLVGPAADAIVAARRVLGPQACKALDAACLQGPTTLVLGKTEPKLKGPLGLAAALSENVLLEYATGMPADQVAWGAGSAATIDALMPAHERSADLMRRTPYIAGHNGFVLARTVLDLLQDRAPGDPHAPPLSPTAQLTMIAGHDTNLSSLSGVFGLDWRLPDQPDSTAPDTTLAFELWRDTGSGALSVRAVVYSQSLAQLRDATPLDAAHPAGVTAVAFDGCAGPDGACRLDQLATLVSARLPRACFAASPATTPLPSRPR
jgi:4-phytase/acid phosphatase